MGIPVWGLPTILPGLTYDAPTGDLIQAAPAGYRLKFSDGTYKRVLMTGSGFLSVVNQSYPLAGSTDFSIDGGGSISARGTISSYFGDQGQWYVPKGVSTTTNPGAANDTTQGFIAGSRWINTATGQAWTCIDATGGAAVWLLMDSADHPGYLSGGAYILAPQSATAAIVPTGDTIAYFTPFFVKSRVTVNQMGMRIGTTAGTSSAVKFAMYANNTTTMRPTGAPLAFSNSGTSTTTISTNIRQDVRDASSPTPLQAVLVPGVMYWAASKHTGTTLPFVTMVGASSNTNAILLGLSTLTATSQYIGVTAPQAYGTDWPSASGLSFTAVNGSTTFPQLEMVVA